MSGPRDPRTGGRPVRDVDADDPAIISRSMSDVARVAASAASGCPCSATATPLGAIVVARLSRAVPGAAGRAAADLRRPGGHRDRERAPVQRAGGAQPRAAGRAGAADRDQRDPAGDRALHPSSSRCSRPSPRTRPGCARRSARLFRFDGELLRSWRVHIVIDGVRACLEDDPSAPGAPQPDARGPSSSGRRSTSPTSGPTPSTSYGPGRDRADRTVLAVPLLRADGSLGDPHLPAGSQALHRQPDRAASRPSPTRP